MNDNLTCVTCGHPKPEADLRHWEGEPWCVDCLRGIAVQRDEQPARRESTILEPIPWEDPDAGSGWRRLFVSWAFLCWRPMRFYRHMPPNGSLAKPVLFMLLVATIVAPISLPGTLLASGPLEAMVQRHQDSIATPATLETDEAASISAAPAATDIASRPPWTSGAVLGLLGYQWALVPLGTISVGLWLHLLLQLMGQTPRATLRCTMRIQCYASAAVILLLAPSVLGAGLWVMGQIALMSAGLRVCYGTRVVGAFSMASLAMTVHLLVLSLLLNYALDLGR